MVVKSKVFISYSRKDIEFAGRLHTALVNSGQEAWIDWINIPKSANWMKEIQAGIENADTFVFVISPDSIKSEVCLEEIKIALNNHKRLVPIVWREPEDRKPPDEISSLNWIFFRENDDFNQAFLELERTIDTDLDWVANHTRLLVRAREWEENDRNVSFLLQRDDLKKAEDWLAASAKKEPKPTELQTRYILSSRQYTNRRQRNLLVIGSIALITSIVLGVLAYINGQQATINANNLGTQVVLVENSESTAVAESYARATSQVFAETQQRIAEERALVSLSRQLSAQAIELQDRELTLSQLLSIEAYRIAPTVEARASLFSSIYHTPRLITSLRGLDANVLGLAINPDRNFLAANVIYSNISLWDIRNLLNPNFLHDKLPGGGGNLHFFQQGDMIFAEYLGSGYLYDISNGQAPIDAGAMELGTGIVAYRSDNNYASVHATSFWENQPGPITLWDISNLKHPLKIDFTPGEDLFNSSAFSEKGNLFALAGANNRIYAYDISDPEKYLLFFSYNLIDVEAITSLAFSPDTRILAVAGSDGIIRLLNISDTSNISIFSQVKTSHEERIRHLYFNKDGKTLLSIDDIYAELWQISNPPVLSIDEIYAQLWGVSKPSALSVEDVYTKFSNLSAQTLDNTFTEFLAQSNSSPPLIGDLVAKLWQILNPTSVTQIDLLPIQNANYPSVVAFDSNDNILASAGCIKSYAADCLEGEVILWNTGTVYPPQSEIFELGGNKKATYLTFINQDTLIVGICERDALCSQWELASLQINDPDHFSLARFTQQSLSNVGILDATPSGQVLAFASNCEIYLGEFVYLSTNYCSDLDLYSLSEDTREYDWRAKLDVEQVVDILFDSSEKRIVTLSGKGIQIWDISNIESPLALNSPVNLENDWITRIAGIKEEIIIDMDISGINIWDFSNRADPKQMVSWFSEDTDQLPTAAKMSPDNNLVVIADRENNLHFVEINDSSKPEELVVLPAGMEGYITNIAFSPDARTLATGSMGGIIRLFDISNPAMPVALGDKITGFVPGNQAIAFSPDGDILVWSSTGGIVITDIGFEKLQLYACLRARRNLTQTEWNQYFSDTPYHTTCPQWPSLAVE